MAGRIGLQQISIRRDLRGNDLLHTPQTPYPHPAVQEIEKALDIPSMSVKFVIKLHRKPHGEFARHVQRSVRQQKGIRLTVNGADSQ